MLSARHLRRHGTLLLPRVSIKSANASYVQLPITTISCSAASPSAPHHYHSTDHSGPSRARVDPKGKGRECHDAGITTSTSSFDSRRGVMTSGVLTTSYIPTPTSERSTYRAFHASARRDALPLLPVTIAVLKGTSVLTLATGISRIIVSFLPIGTIAAFKMMKISKWIDSDDIKPNASPEAEEFFKMWCEDEKVLPMTKEEALSLTDAKMDNDCCLIAEDGRIAYHIRMLGRDGRVPAEGWASKRPKRRHLIGRENASKNSQARNIRGHYFFIPSLPPASVRYFNELTPTQQAEVHALRRYWMGIQMFKRHFKPWHIALFSLFGLPIVLLGAVYIAGLERTPLTGRWRIILLTPDEEDVISKSLAGGNWYRSVINLLTTPERPAPPVLPESDWRWAWVQATLSRLEQATVACNCPLNDETAIRTIYPPSYPPPPAPEYPLTPRPRASSMLHSVLPGGEPGTGREHLEIGPPYNLMLMQKSERNAFSFGFGGKRAGGIVVYSGLLDNILRDSTPALSPQPQAARTGLFSGLFSSPATASRPARPQPTEEQTLHLACVLAHEMGHLLLSHNLESLSQRQVLWPSMLGLGMDLVRAVLFPITWILGPAVNDALANMGRTSTEELAERYGEIECCRNHEYEADLAGMRILALAGFDPAAAVNYLSKSVAELHEMQPDSQKEETSLTSRMFKLWTQATHPSPDQRREAIQKELGRWRVEAERAKTVVQPAS